MEELFKIKERKIKISNSETITILEKTLFLANGEEGLHLWEASILFSRYIYKFPHLFENRNIIELGKCDIKIIN